MLEIRHLITGYGESAVLHGIDLTVSAVALSAAAAKCADLAVEEERKQLRIVAQIVAAQMSNINTKLTALNNLESILSARTNALRSTSA